MVEMGMGCTTLGSPLVRLPAAGCHVPVDRRQRTGESAAGGNGHGKTGRW
jgi:hypothetical protein